MMVDKNKSMTNLALGALILACAASWYAGTAHEEDKSPVDFVPITGLPAPNFMSAECVYVASERDLTKEELDQGTILPAPCYRDALYFGRENAIISIERGFRLNKVSPEVARKTRDTAFLYMAETYPRRRVLDLGLSYGADINARDKSGRGVEELIIKSDVVGQNRIDQWDLLFYLHENHGRRFDFLEKEGTFFWSLLSEADLPREEDKIIKVLDEVRTIFDLHSVVLEDSVSGLNLLHIAARGGSIKLMEYIHDNKLALDPWDHRGSHVFDYASPSFRKTLVENFGMKKPERPPRSPALMTSGEFMRAYLEKNSKRYVPLRGEDVWHAEPESDFSMYKPIRYDHNVIPDNGINPSLVIAEYVAYEAAEEIWHIHNTSRAALGTSRALGSKTWQDVIAVKENPGSFYGEALTTILKFNRNDYVIVSNSIYEDVNKKSSKIYQARDSFFPNFLGRTDVTQFIYYKSVGNMGEFDPCLSVDNISFCMQDGGEIFHHINTVTVGAARLEKNKNMVIEGYSYTHPTFCALLPYNHGWLYHGTSFSAPAAAAVEERLADIFARSASFPEGVVHEDILMALMLTAKSENLIDEKTDHIVPVYRNVAGIKMNDRCGAGVIHEQKAADLLSKMVKWTRHDPAIFPTQGETVRIDLNHYRGKKNQDGRTEYTYKVEQDGILTQIRAGVSFPTKKKGAALIQIGDRPAIPLDLSASGLTTEFRFAGHAFKKGDSIKLIVTQPMKEMHWWDKQSTGFIDLRMVQPESPISRAIQEITDQKGYAAPKSP